MEEKKTNNLVAKHARKYNKAAVHKDRKKAMKKGDRKHKGSYESVEEVLKVSDGASAWIKDFQSSDAPQFKGKSMDKRKEMAIAAYLDAKKGSKEESMNEKKGLWDRIHAKRKRGEKPAKPGDKGYPKTLDVGEAMQIKSHDVEVKHKGMTYTATGKKGKIKGQDASEYRNKSGGQDRRVWRNHKTGEITAEGLKQARKNVGADSCWDGYKAKGTKMKGGKEVPDCKKESAQSRLDRMAAKHGLGKPNKAADDYLSKMMKKYGAKDMADLKKKMGMKESVDVTKKLHELTKREMEMLAKRKQKNLVKRGKAKPEPKKPRQAGAGRVSNVGAGKSEADDNLIMQLRKAKDLKGKSKIKFRGGETELPLNLINKLLATHDKLSKPQDKKKLETMITHELRKRSGLSNKQPSASDKAMSKFQKSRERGIPAPRGKGKGPSDKELRDIERGK
jgi:hypothetical protein